MCQPQHTLGCTGDLIHSYFVSSNNVRIWLDLCSVPMVQVALGIYSRRNYPHMAFFQGLWRSWHVLMLEEASGCMWQI